MCPHLLLVFCYSESVYIIFAQAHTRMSSCPIKQYFTRGTYYFFDVLSPQFFGPPRMRICRYSGRWVHKTDKYAGGKKNYQGKRIQVVYQVWLLLGNAVMVWKLSGQYNEAAM